MHAVSGASVRADERVRGRWGEAMRRAGDKGTGGQERSDEDEEEKEGAI